jgi:acyl-CoA synthetase (AMP-forming)/AMP-acid ligase II
MIALRPIAIQLQIEGRTQVGRVGEDVAGKNSAVAQPLPAVRAAQAAEYRRQGHWRGVPIGDAFADTCRRHARRVALVDGPLRLEFAEWERRVRRAALGLLALGVGPGDVVAYQLPNWWEAAVVFLAAARLGATVNPLLPIFRERELRFVLRQSKASVLVIPARFRDFDYPQLIAHLRPELPALAQVLVARGEAPAGMRALDAFLDTPWERAPQTADRVVRDVDPASLLMLMYTSGTTAEPKGVLHSHQTLTAEVRSLERVHGLAPGDVTLMPSPLTHISGVIHAILTPALVGTSAVLMDRWDPRLGLEWIERERVTYMVGAPTFLRDLAEHPDLPDFDVSSLRLFSCGGADVSPALIRQARARLGCVAKRVYGSTEFPTITTTDAADADAMGGESEGRAIAPNRVRVADDEGHLLPPGASGEVQARGPECFLGYADARLDAEVFTADGWFRTGDLGVLDERGYLRICGRIKEIVIRKGEKISVREVEELVARHPAVSDAAVVAVPDADTGERACAAVVLRDGASLTLAELGEFLIAAGLAKQKLPERLAVVSALPRTESGKIQRAALRQSLTAPDCDAQEKENSPQS